MKKIISLLSVFAMLATLFTTVAFADDNNKFYIKETVDGTNVTLTFLVKSNQQISAASGSLDLTAAYAACDNISATKANASVFNLNTTQKVIAWNYADTTGFTGELELGSVTFENVKSDFAMPQKKAFKATVGSTNVTASFTNEQVGYTVKAPTVTPAGPEVADLEDGGDMYGMKTKVAKVTTNGAEVSKAIVKLGDESKSYDLPAGVSGTADFIAIIRYAASLVNPAFTLSVE